MDDIEEIMEQYGELFKNLGQGDTSGKILAILFAGENPKITLDELSEKLGRSKSTVHSAVKKLLEGGLVVYDVDDDTPSEGRYQHLYKFNEDFWESRLRQVDSITIFTNLLSDSLDHVRARDPEDTRINTLRELRDMYLWFQERIPTLFEEWDEIRKEKYQR